LISDGLGDGRVCGRFGRRRVGGHFAGAGTF
jgi:hypothetical protein